MKRFERIQLPYDDDRFIEVNIPMENFVGAYSSRDIPPIVDMDRTVWEVLNNPIGSPSLASLAREASRVLFVVDDNTRRTPVYKILPIAVGILNEAGLNDGDIKILFAAGTHREMTEKEKIDKIGLEMMKRFECTAHDYLGETISFGSTRYGTPVEVNPLLGWSDLIIAIGSVIPHAYCGWGGGGKIVLPGISGARSILATHLLPYQNQEIGIGVVQNQARVEIDEASLMVGLRFIINTILNASGGVVDIVAGSPIPAHRTGIRKAIEVQGISVPSADLVFGCSYPEHSCYWQANKAFHPMEITVNHGGLAVMVAGMSEGRGEHPSCFDAMGESEDDLVKRLDDLKYCDFSGALAIACALGDRKLFKKARVGIVSDGLPQGDTAHGAFLRFETPDDAVRQILWEKPDAKIGCLLNAPEMLPLRDAR